MAARPRSGIGMLPATGWPAAAATCSLMLAMTWPAIAAVLAGLSENSSLPDRVSVTPTSGPSRRPFYGLPRWVTWWVTHHRSQT
jgi:hypothetical protein